VKLLDLFCGAGGAAMGYYRAGFTDIVGVDIKPQPRYPFTFIQADAMTFPLEGYDLIHASPPCQSYAITNNIWKKSETYPDLVDPVRTRLIAQNTPFVIENVPGAPLVEYVMLCGTMFGLRIIRHRLFESREQIYTLLPPCAHLQRASYGRTPKDDECFTISGHFGDVAGARKAMGIDWMTRDELAQAIPPAYTEWIGQQIIRGWEAKE
jgi:DNA (cytosine-5)-methyltransferase 1